MNSRASDLAGATASLVALLERLTGGQPATFQLALAPNSVGKSNFVDAGGRGDVAAFANGWLFCVVLADAFTTPTGSPPMFHETNDVAFVCARGSSAQAVQTCGARVVVEGKRGFRINLVGKPIRIDEIGLLDGDRNRVRLRDCGNVTQFDSICNGTNGETRITRPKSVINATEKHAYRAIRAERCSRCEG